MQRNTIDIIVHLTYGVPWQNFCTVYSLKHVQGLHTHIVYHTYRDILNSLRFIRLYVLINDKKCSLSTVFTATHRKLQKS